MMVHVHILLQFLRCTDPTAYNVMVRLPIQMTGPWWGWDPWAGPDGCTDPGHGTWTFTFSPAPTGDM